MTDLGCSRQGYLEPTPDVIVAACADLDLVKSDWAHFNINPAEIGAYCRGEQTLDDGILRLIREVLWHRRNEIELGNLELGRPSAHRTHQVSQAHDPRRY